ncbi:MAG TPA: TatD family hydrolase [Candidatus Saccharimonadales bacterium]|jgi:TatD DNase family protein
MMTLKLVDAHCHIHEAAEHFAGESETRIRWQRTGNLTPDAMIRSAADVGVTRLICVGTTLRDSELAVNFVQKRENCWASIGIHPHEAKDHLDKAKQNALVTLATKPKVVAVGECGLDYIYEHSPKEAQAKILRLQIELALEADLPMIFHVRDAFDDFWPIFDEYKNIRGVIHSFSASQKELDEILKRDLYVGLNGIMTFSKNSAQLAAAKAVPLDKLVVETDAPFLTPAPERGKICEPKHVQLTAQFLSDLRGETLETFAAATTRNACQLFGLT